MNWVGLNDRQVAGTIFIELKPNDWYQKLDLHSFYDRFELSSRAGVSDPSKLTAAAEHKGPVHEKAQILKPDRLKQIAICGRRVNVSHDQIAKAVHSLDLKLLPIDQVEQLKRLAPSDPERDQFHYYTEMGGDEATLVKEERWILPLCNIPRLQDRLSIMRFMATFANDSHVLDDQIQSVILACDSLMQSQQFRSFLEVIVALGNYMNNCKRPVVSGFRLKSLKVIILLLLYYNDYFLKIITINIIINSLFMPLSMFF